MASAARAGRECRRRAGLYAAAGATAALTGAGTFRTGAGAALLLAAWAALHVGLIGAALARLWPARGARAGVGYGLAVAGLAFALAPAWALVCVPLAGWPGARGALEFAGLVWALAIVGAGWSLPLAAAVAGWLLARWRRIDEGGAARRVLHPQGVGGIEPPLEHGECGIDRGQR